MKKHRHYFHYCLFLLAGVLLWQNPVQLHATNITMSGNCSWQISGSSIDISVAKVSNNSSGGTSGTLRLQVWATTSPYAGGTINGYILGTRTLGQLNGGYYYTGISGYVTYSAPPGGYYYTTITVEEYTGSGYVIDDYITFSGTTYLGSGGGGGGGGSGTVNLEGTVGWSINGSKITMTAATVANHTANTSGTLRLETWATSTPYSGGTINGYILGTYSLGTLQSGYVFNNVSGSVAYKVPPSGTYYTTLTLEEYTVSGYIIDDYVTFDSTVTLGSGSGGGGVGGSPGGSGGDLQLVGNASYSISKKKGVTLKMDEVLNDRSSGTSGTLRLRLWATATPYAGGSIYGYVLGTDVLGTLNAGYYYYNINKTVPYTAPPKGTYYLTLTLEEYDSVYYIMDYINFPKTYKAK